MKIVITDEHFKILKRLGAGFGVLVGIFLFLYYGFTIKVNWWPVVPDPPTPIIIWCFAVFALSVIFALIIWGLTSLAWKIGKGVVG